MKILKAILLIVSALIVIIIVQNFRFRSKQSFAFGERKDFPVDTSAISHLCSAVRIPTISMEGHPVDTAAFRQLRDLFHVTYPEVYSSLEEKVIGDGSLLLKWKGINSSVKPVIFYAHLDVVPCDSTWNFSPFLGKADEKYIYGRGVIDDKGAVISILESLNQLIASGFHPKRDVYFAFGYDEETGGRKGAKAIADHLKSSGVKAEFLLDEGGIIADGMVPFVNRPVALVATAEKGYVCFRLTVKSEGGHSSMPPAEPPVELLAEALKKVHDHPFETRMTPPLQQFIDFVGPEMNYPFRILFANSTLFRPLIFSEYEKIPGANAMIRTTSVTTMIEGGVKENVIPQKVSAVVNFRLLQGDHPADIKRKLEELLADKRIIIERLDNPDEPSEISSIESDGFKMIDKSIRTVFPDVIVSPNLSTGGTDSKHFRQVTENIYRFLPTRMNEEILDGMHGRNEKMELKSFMEMMAFYKSLIGQL